MCTEQRTLRATPKIGQSTVRPPHVTMQPVPNTVIVTFKKDESTQFLHTTYPFKITYAYCIESSGYFQESTDVTREADRAGRPHQCRMREAFRVRRQPSLQFNCEWGGGLSDNQEGERK